MESLIGYDLKYKAKQPEGCVDQRLVKGARVGLRMNVGKTTGH